MSLRKIAVATLSMLGLVCIMSSDAKDPKDKVSDDGLTVSHDCSKDPPFEWTLERMLLAQPMPMTAEGRKFLSTHPNLDGIRDWDDAKFGNYLDSDYAKQHVAEEAVRWRDLAAMLEGQLTRGSKLIPTTSFIIQKSLRFGDWSKSSIDDIRKALEGNDRSKVFQQMRAWRQQIADQASKVEAMRKEAEKRGLSEELEKLISE